MPEQITLSGQITTIYCLCDDFLRAWGRRDDPQAQMTDAEVMTTALVAAAIFNGNQERSRRFLMEHGYIRAMLSKSRLNRRLHAVPESLWQALFGLLADVHRQMASASPGEPAQYAVDSMPVPACDNIRIRRCRLYPCRHRVSPGAGGAKEGRTRRPRTDKTDEPFWGYCASKRRYFYGLRVHLLVTTGGLPVEVMLAPGAEADVAAFKSLPLDLAPGSRVFAPGSRVFADAGYLDDQEQAMLSEGGDIALVNQRRGNCKRQLLPWVRYICKRERERVETVFSQLASALGRGVHAVTPRGFELKVYLTVLAYSILA